MNLLYIIIAFAAGVIASQVANRGIIMELEQQLIKEHKKHMMYKGLWHEHGGGK